MLRPLSFVAVRQQQHYSRILSPLGSIGRDELIDDRLRYVHEIAVLRFPQHQRVFRRCAVAVLESKYRGLGQRAVVDLDSGARSVSKVL